MQSIIAFFSSDHLSPHGFCLLWRPDLLRLHVVSDALIGLAYFSIPVSLAVLVRRRTDLQFGWIFWLLPAFILSCGVTHWFAVWTIWHPDYALEGLAKAFTAAISVVTAVVLWPLMPKLIAAPGLAQMTGVNTALQAEIRDRILLEAKLTSLNTELEARVAARTAELTTLNQALQKGEDRFRQVVEAAPSAMLMVDPAGRIVMMNKQAEMVFGGDRADLLGQPVEKLIPVPLRDGHQQLRDGFFAAPESRPMGAGRDLYALRQDGTTFPVEIGLNPIETEDGTMVLSAIVDISDRKQREERINAALKEKDVLLAEIHHRVKNNLQIVHSLLDLQSSRVSDPIALEMLRESRNRISSMAIIHQILYTSHDFRQVDFGNVLRALVPHLVASYGIGDRHITVAIEADTVFLPLNTAIPCGLIVNELISNALKHGFPEGREGHVAVSLREDGPGHSVISVSDTGIGISDQLDPEMTPSLGLKLVHLLADQIGGTITVERRNPTRITLRFPLQK